MGFMSKVAAALWLAAGFASGAPVSVSIPNADVLQGATVSVHLKATGVVLADSLIAYQVTLVYPSAMLQAVGASKASTMTQNWNDPTVGLKPDTLRVVGMTTNQPSKRWVADDANLVDLSFLVVGAASQAATVKIHEAKLFGKAGALTVDSKTNGVLTIVDNPATKTVNMDLAVGWNLVSFALAPDVSAIPDVFASASVGFVFGYVSGIGPKTWDSVRPSFLNDLKAVDALHGYWIRLKGTSAYPLSVTGAPVSVSTPMLLYKGWGLVGYLPDSRDSLSHALASLGRAYRFVSAYEALGTGTHTWDRSRPVFLNDLDILGPGLGYWMKMDSIKTLVYPTSGYKVTKAARDLAVQPRRRVLSSSKWCDFWA